MIFDVKKQRGIALSMTTLFQNPTLREFASVIDAATDLSPADKQDSTPPEMDYHLDGEVLAVKYIPKSIPPIVNPPETFLVTGASSFLGAHILSDLLNRPHTKVIALVRAGNPKDALKRIKKTCLAYGIWSEEWPGSRLECIIGDLSRPNLGVHSATWQRLENTVDVVIHNGARVHWIHTYTEMKPTNVLATIACILLCSTGRPKCLTFISSTAVLDTPSHLNGTVLESDDLFGSHKGLSTGYAQTKYVSEYLIREAGKQGLRGSIVRPGYITGNASTGIGPTDDFLLRMLKGSIQLHARPDLSPNTINLVPVSHCARIVVAASVHPPMSEGVGVVQVTPHPQLPWNDFLGSLETFGYEAPLVPYEQWKTKLEEYVANPSPATSSTTTQPSPITGTVTDGSTLHYTNGPHSTVNSEPHALLPLFDWVTSSLPTSTTSRHLSDTNTRSVMHADDPAYPFEECSRVTEDTVGVYLAFMVGVGFIPLPTEGKGEGRKKLPVLKICGEQRVALGGVGRSGR